MKHNALLTMLMCGSSVISSMTGPTATGPPLAHVPLWPTGLRPLASVLYPLSDRQERLDLGYALVASAAEQTTSDLNSVSASSSEPAPRNPSLTARRADAPARQDYEARGDPNKNVVVVIGATGSGKSTFLNLLNGDVNGTYTNGVYTPPLFETFGDERSGTEDSLSKTIKWLGKDDGQEVVIVDTPGLCSSNHRDTDIIANIVAELQRLDDLYGGVARFLIVVPGSDCKVDNAMQAILDTFRQVFTRNAAEPRDARESLEKFLTYCTLVFTHWDYTQAGIDTRVGEWSQSLRRPLTTSEKLPSMTAEPNSIEGWKKEGWNKSVKNGVFGAKCRVNCDIPCVFVDSIHAGEQQMKGQAYLTARGRRPNCTEPAAINHYEEQLRILGDQIFSCTEKFPCKHSTKVQSRLDRVKTERDAAETKRIEAEDAAEAARLEEEAEIRDLREAEQSESVATRELADARRREAEARRVRLAEEERLQRQQNEHDARRRRAEAPVDPSQRIDTRDTTVVRTEQRIIRDPEESYVQFTYYNAAGEVIRVRHQDVM